MIKYKGIKTLEVLEGANNYNRWIAEQFLSRVKTPILEVGAGIGNISSFLTSLDSVFITDIDKGLVTFLKEKFTIHKNVHVEVFDIEKKSKKKYLKYFSTVLAVNVLEHIEDDMRALENISHVLKRNGELHLLVPAKQFAYTKLDKELGHYRRYEKNELQEKLKKTGYIVDSIYFLNFVGLASWAIRGQVRKNSPALKPHHIKLFDTIVPLLKGIERKISIPVGISLVVIARKKS